MRTQREGTVYLELNVIAPKLPAQQELNEAINLTDYVTTVGIDIEGAVSAAIYTERPLRIRHEHMHLFEAVRVRRGIVEQKVSNGALIPQPADERIQEIAEQVAKDFGMHPDEVVVELQKIVQAANQITQDQELVNTFTRARPSRLPVGDYPGQVPAFRNRRPKRL